VLIALLGDDAVTLRRATEDEAGAWRATATQLMGRQQWRRLKKKAAPKLADAAD
jgi:hypothetical protein